MNTIFFKSLFLTIAFFSFFNLSAQKISYGVIFGGNIFNDQVSNSGPNDVYFDSGNDNFVVSNLGGYVEYELAATMGIKVEITYNQKVFEKGFANSDLGEMYQLSFIDINPNFKYDFGQEYRRGFYMLLGPKIALLTNAKFKNENIDVTADFESVNVGMELGAGQRFLKFLEIEGKLDYGLTPFYKAEGSIPNKLVGFYFSLNVDLERIINQKK